MKRLSALALLLLTVLCLTAADNYRQGDTRVTGTTDPVVLRTTDTAGVHTPHVIVDAGAAASGATLVSSAAYEASHVIKSGAGTLISLVGYNSKSSAQFVQVFNASAVPSDAAVPIYTFSVAATSNFSLDVPITGAPFSTGICVANSSTGATKTIGGSDVFFTAVMK